MQTIFPVLPVLLREGRAGGSKRGRSSFSGWLRPLDVTGASPALLRAPFFFASSRTILTSRVRSYHSFVADNGRESLCVREGVCVYRKIEAKGHCDGRRGEGVVQQAMRTCVQ